MVETRGMKLLTGGKGVVMKLRGRGGRWREVDDEGVENGLT